MNTVILLSCLAGPRETASTGPVDTAPETAHTGLHSPDTQGDTGVWESPNILVISFDTLPRELWDTMEATQAWLTQTGGTMLSEHWSTAPFTYPSMVSVLTGRFPTDYGSFIYHEGEPEVLPGTEVTTLAEILSEHGYENRMLVTGGGMVGETTGLDQGYTHYEVFTEDPVGQVDRFVDLLSQAQEQPEPWLGHAHFMVTHDPYTQFADSCREEAQRTECLIEGLDWNSTDALDVLMQEIWSQTPAMQERCWEEARRRQSCEATYLDGLVSSMLPELPIEEDTLLLLLADHGESYDRRGIGHNLGLFPEQVRVGAWLRIPGEDVGSIAHTTTHLDLLPTILSQLGVEEELPGVPVFEEHESPAVSVYIKGVFSVSGVTNDGKYRYEEDLNGYAWLYDLVVDPQEEVNLIMSLAPPEELVEAVQQELDVIEEANSFR